MMFYMGCRKIFIPLLSLPIFQVLTTINRKYLSIAKENYCGFDTPSPYLPKKWQFDNHKNEIFFIKFL